MKELLLIIVPPMRQVLSSLAFLLLFNYSSFAIATTNFVKIKLPKGVSIDLPRNWVVFSRNQRITQDTAVESALDLSNLEDRNHDLNFAANYYDDHGNTMGIINFRYYPDIEFSQRDVSDFTFSGVGEGKVIEDLNKYLFVLY